MTNITPEDFEKILPVSDDIETAVLDFGVLTGSARFFSYEAASDIDYIMPPNCLELLESLTSPKEVDALFYGDPRHTTPVYVKLKTFDKPVNLIFTGHEEAFDAWVDTTSIISDIIFKYPNFKHALEERKNRVDLFAVLRTMLLSPDKSREGVKELTNEKTS